MRPDSAIVTPLICASSAMASRIAVMSTCPTLVRVNIRNRPLG